MENDKPIPYLKREQRYLKDQRSILSGNLMQIQMEIQTIDKRLANIDSLMNPDREFTAAIDRMLPKKYNI